VLLISPTHSWSPDWKPVHSVRLNRNLACPELFVVFWLAFSVIGRVGVVGWPGLNCL